MPYRICQNIVMTWTKHQKHINLIESFLQNCVHNLDEHRPCESISGSANRRIFYSVCNILINPKKIINHVCF